MTSRFADRATAGRLLGRALADAYRAADPVVLALPRGGVPVAAEVARALRAQLDVFVVRKLGLPTQPELAFGAVASGGVRVLNPDVVANARLDPAVIDQLSEAGANEVARREHTYRGDRPRPAIEGRTVVLVDDGIATGATVRAAISAIRSSEPVRLVVAAPVAPIEVVRQLRGVADNVAVLIAAKQFGSVGYFYTDFHQLTDAEVRALLGSPG